MAHNNHNEECVTVLENYPSSCSSSIIQSSSNYNNWWTINSDLHASSNHLLSSSSWTTTMTNNNNNNINDHHQSSGDDEDENSVSTTTFTNLSNHDSSDLSDVSVRNNNSNNIFAEGGGGGRDGNDHQLWNHLLLSIGCGEELQNPTLLTTPFNDAGTVIKNHHHHHLIQTPASTTDESLIIKSSLLSSDMVVDDNVMINNWQIPNQDSTIITTTPNDLLPPPPPRESGGGDHHHYNMMMNYMTNDDHWGGSIPCNNFSDHHGHDHHHQYYSSRINDSSWNNDEYYSRILASRRSRSLNNSVSTADYSNNMMRRPAPAAPLMLDITLSKPFLKTLDLSAGVTRNYKQGVRNSLFPSRTSSSISKTTQNRRNGRTQGKGIFSDHNHHHHHQGRKLLLHNSVDSLSKKPKQDSSSSLLLSTKGQMQQVPKVKLGDKITALQQIVSPFGKTDTASVLWESIGYIRFLQEQIQLLSTPYLKGCASKEIWGGMERKKEIRENNNKNGVFELRSRGLCLVPISCTPQLLSPPSDTNHNPVAVVGAAVSDYYTPVYRGCLYR